MGRSLIVELTFVTSLAASCTFISLVPAFISNLPLNLPLTWIIIVNESSFVLASIYSGHIASNMLFEFPKDPHISSDI